MITLIILTYIAMSFMLTFGRDKDETFKERYIESWIVLISITAVVVGVVIAVLVVLVAVFLLLLGISWIYTNMP